MEQQRKEIDLVDQLASLEVAKQQQRQQRQLTGSGGHQGPLIPDLALPASFVPPYPGPNTQPLVNTQPPMPPMANTQPPMTSTQPPMASTQPLAQSQSVSQSPSMPSQGFLPNVGVSLPPNGQSRAHPPPQTPTQVTTLPQGHSGPPQTVHTPPPQAHTLHPPQALPVLQPHTPATVAAVAAALGVTEAALAEQVSWYVQQGVPQAAALAALQKHGQDHANVASFVASSQGLVGQGFPLPRVLQSLSLAHPNHTLVMQLLQHISRLHPDARLMDALRVMNNDVVAANIFLEGVVTLTEMGYEYMRAANAMLANGNDVNAAVTTLLDSD